MRSLFEPKTFPAVLVSLLALGASAAGCASKGEPPEDALGGEGGAAPITGGSRASGGEAGSPHTGSSTGGRGGASSGAVLVAAQVVGLDTYQTYVGVFPEVPEGTVGLWSFREFGNAIVYNFGGYVFVEQDGIVTRFAVSEDLELVEGPSFSWQDLGIAEANATYTVFASTKRAYTFAPALGVTVVWNPETMKRTSLLEVDLLDRPSDWDLWAYSGHLVGDKIIWNVFSGSFESSAVYPAVTLAIADANKDEPLRYVEDDRCLPGGPAFVDERGDYYVHGAAYFGYFYAYGTNLAADARTCVLRVRAGQETFDPSYLADYKEMLGSYVSEPWYQITGSQYLTRAWDPSVPFPEVSDDFWAGTSLLPKLVDLETKRAEPYPGLEGTLSIDGVTYGVDGSNYYQANEEGYAEGAEVDVYELHPSGPEKKFHLEGVLLALERIR
jgi:hypothetical protein